MLGCDGLGSPSHLRNRELTKSTPNSDMRAARLDCSFDGSAS
jgi:hypothetical protein